MIYYSPTAKRIAQQKRWLHWLAEHGPVWNPDTSRVIDSPHQNHKEQIEVETPEETISGS